MKKIFFLLFPLIFLIGCEKEFDTVIDSEESELQVINSLIEAPLFINNQYTILETDSTFTFRLTFNRSSGIKTVYVDIFSSEDKKLNSSPVVLLDNGRPSNGDVTAKDNIFSGNFVFSRNYPVGNYEVKYYITDNNDITKPVALLNFFYNNGQDNSSPVIANAVIEPDTVSVTSTTLIFTSVYVTDSNGSNDIEEVYFIVYRPDGSTSNNKTFLYDDGSCCQLPPSNALSGDAVAGDSTYSRIIQVDQNNVKGTYRFEFRAKDRSGRLSNIINHFVRIN